MLFAHGISRARCYVVLAVREKAALVTSSKDVGETARVGAGIDRTITPKLVGTPAAGDDTAVTPGLVVGTPPKKRRVRPGDSARKRKEAKKAGDDTAVTPDHDGGFPDPNFLQALASRRLVAFFISFYLSQYIFPTNT